MLRDFSSFLPAGVSPAFAVVAQIFWVLQIALAIHVYRTGRPYWWLWLLFSAPMIGGVAYLLIEVMPDVRSPRGLFYGLKPRKWRIADLRRELDESETIDNRLSLAEELFDGGDVQGAHDVAVECLRGVFKNDPRTLVDVARYKYALGSFADGLSLLDKVDTQRDRMLALEVARLRGDCLCGLKQFAEAETAYESIVGRYIGEAPRFGLAAVYENTGRVDEAIATWTDIRHRFRRASSAWRRSEKKWYKLATSKLEARKS